MKAVGYIRVSTDEQAKRLSPEVQEELIIDYGSRSGYEVLNVFRDIGVSGSISLRIRPGFQQLLDFCLRNNVKVVIALSLDRLTREPDDLDYIAELIQLHDMKFITIYEGEITLEKISRTETRFKTYFDKEYRAFARERTFTIMHASKKLRFGIGKLSQIVKTDDEFTQLINKIINDFKSGKAIYKIAHETGLTEKQIKFILWIFDLWTVNPSKCPRCGSGKIERDKEYRGFIRCRHCGFVYPLTKTTWDKMLQSESDRLLLNKLYEPYIVKLIEIRQTVINSTLGGGHHSITQHLEKT